MEALFKRLLTDKGTKSYRTLLLVVVYYVAQKVTSVDNSLDKLNSGITALERRVEHIEAANREAQRVTVGPEWPKKATTAFQR